MNEYSLKFDEKWDTYFSKLDKTMQKRVWKKIQQLKQTTYSRHLKLGFPFFVTEIGQYRLCYKIDGQQKTKTMYFVGTHKDYEKWTGIKLW
ncbi:MAG: type II toxin-antitoxin system HigB family toxin [Candidatus Diapherotrites archaeon]|nr:type II toxin-antitoxin system HigB family toxin [Candidatus Diapherotrites archaeon]